MKALQIQQLSQSKFNTTITSKPGSPCFHHKVGHALRKTNSFYNTTFSSQPHTLQSNTLLCTKKKNKNKTNIFSESTSLHDTNSHRILHNPWISIQHELSIHLYIYIYICIWLMSPQVLILPPQLHEKFQSKFSLC